MIKIIVCSIFIFFDINQFYDFTDEKKIMPKKNIMTRNTPIKTDNKIMKNVVFLINQKKYKVIFYENNTTKEILKMIPISINMSDFNGNEKMYVLDKKLPVSEIYPWEINAWDIMLWQDNTLVIFYKSFKTEYAYTKIWYFEDINLLKENLWKEKNLHLQILLN